jgi:hypothetical protein
MSSLDADKLKVFTGRANPLLAQRICEYLQIPLGRGRTELFPDGELIVKDVEDVRGRDCYVIQPTSHPVNAHLVELFIWIDALKRASAKHVTAVIPYFGYARQDQKHAGRTPVTAKLVANLLERAGADRVVTVDLNEKVEVTVPLELKGTPKGEADGGVLHQVMAQIEVECRVLEIPDAIRHNVSEMALNDILHVRDLKFPTDVRAIPSADLIVATVKEIQEEVAAPEAAEAGAAEPEIIGRKAGEEGEAAEGAAAGEKEKK